MAGCGKPFMDSLVLDDSELLDSSSNQAAQTVRSVNRIIEHLVRQLDLPLLQTLQVEPAS